MSAAGVAIIGSGVAGTAAALAASRAGARVTMLDGGTGASSLWTGAVHADGDASAEAGSMAAALGVTLASARLVTTVGYVALAQGHDSALLNLAPLDSRRARVGVVRCDRPGWDADVVARAAGDDLSTLDASILRHVEERSLPDGDFAALHDDGARLAWLAERLRDALRRSGSSLGALLLPPSLGIRRERASDLSRLVGLPCGEAMGQPGGPAGLRFENARDRALSPGIVRVHGRATRVERHGDGWHVHLEEGEPLAARVVVLAVGGLVGGGIAYAPSEADLSSVLPPQARAPFRFTVDAPVVLGAGGRPADVPGSLFGVPPESLAWPFASAPLLERIGVLVDGDGRVSAGLYAAGEAVADLPRTWLRALESGMRAGQGAARDTVTGTAARPASLSGAPASRP
jgi:glycerol-3-phosphate dehydrogenase subunit B